MHEQDNERERSPDISHQLHPRIWLGSLSDYNAGILHGAWVDANQPPEELRDQLAAMLAASPSGPGAEEFLIFDHDDFAGIPISEHENLDTVSTLAAALIEHGRPYGAWAALVGVEHADPSKFSDAYLGQYTSLLAYAVDLLYDIGYGEALDKHIPSFIRPYVQLDGSGFARDLQATGEVATADDGEGGVWVYDMRSL